MPIKKDPDTKVTYIKITPPKWETVWHWVMTGHLKDADILKQPCKIVDMITDAFEAGSTKVTITQNPDGSWNMEDGLDTK